MQTTACSGVPLDLSINHNLKKQNKQYNYEYITESINNIRRLSLIIIVLSLILTIIICEIYDLITTRRLRCVGFVGTIVLELQPIVS